MMATASGCATGPMAKAVTKAYNFGQGLLAEMVTVTLWDRWVLTSSEQTVIPAQLATPCMSKVWQKAPPDYSMRMARVNFSNSLPGVPWVEQGQLQVMTGAMVPDYLPQLHQVIPWNPADGHVRYDEQLHSIR